MYFYFLSFQIMFNVGVFKATGGFALDDQFSTLSEAKQRADVLYAGASILRKLYWTRGVVCVRIINTETNETIQYGSV